MNAITRTQKSEVAEPGRCDGCGKVYASARGLRSHQSGKFVSGACRPASTTGTSDATKTEAVTGSPGFTITRHLEGHCYAVSGNAHNPTPRYRYTLELDGRIVDSSQKRSALLAEAKRPTARKDYSA